jgi:hypothetical protein
VIFEEAQRGTARDRLPGPVREAYFALNDALGLKKRRPRRAARR